MEFEKSKKSASHKSEDLLLNGTDYLRLGTNFQCLISFFSINNNKSYSSKKLLEIYKASPFFNFQLTGNFFNYLPKYHGPFLSKNIQLENYLEIPPNNSFLKSLDSVVNAKTKYKNVINNEAIGKFNERVNKIYSDCYKFVFLENSESFKDIMPIKYEHEWSHALVSYDEFICFTHSKNSFFLISLARD